MALIIKEQSLSLCAVCPYCSRHYDITGVREEHGQQIAFADFRKAPQQCERCGSPLEPGADARKFQNAMAVKDRDRYGPGIGRIEEAPAPRTHAEAMANDDE